jgi:nucleoid-associated protein YgaU
MLSLTTPIKIALAAACLVVVAVIIAVDVARTRGREEPAAPAPAAATAMVEALPPAFQPPKPSGEAVICPSPAAPAATPEAPKPAPEPVKAKAVEEPPKTYTVAPGDTLYGISQKVLGSTRHVNRILEMNKDRIKDPNTLQVGINLRMPEVAVTPAR